jgi:hydroxypyruvate isomerase
MPRFAANLSMMYTEVGFLERFALAARDGFAGVEVLFPYEHEAHELRTRLDAQGLTQALFNAPPGRPENSERGLACLPGREAEFRAGIELALAYAHALACPRIHVMAGVEAPDVPRARLRDTYLSNLEWAARRASGQGVDILIEPINRRDVPGYHLNRQDDAHAVVQVVGAPNLKVQMDLYHCQIVEGDVATKIRQYLPTGRVGHFQIAGVPERHEPDLGELHYPYLLGLIDQLATASGWEGWVGCEYRPRDAAAKGGTSSGLGWRQRPAWREEGQ